MDAAGAALLDLYDPALPQVFGYLLRRCGSRDVAEDLTAETFLAAVAAARRATSTHPPPIDVAWLIGVARHKLADHWRRQARDDRDALAIGGDPTVAPTYADPWDVCLDALRAHAVLDVLAPQHRAALTLRYVDDLPVAQVADMLGRTTQATEALLTRAKHEFRTIYQRGEGV